MSGRALQLILVTIAGVAGGVYTFAPMLEDQAKDKAFKKDHDMGPGIVEVPPSPRTPLTEADNEASIQEKK